MIPGEVQTRPGVLQLNEGRETLVINVVNNTAINEDVVRVGMVVCFNQGATVVLEGYSLYHPA